MNTDMKITVNPGMEYLRQFVRQLPELFPASGEVLHDGRNQIRAFDIGGERLVVKRYKRPSAFNAVMYSFFRKSKARRAYEHAPAPARAGNRHARTRRMERIPPQRADNGDLFRIPQVGLHTAHGGYGTVPDLRFAARARSILPFHRPAPRKGICHEDFNQTNILWRHDEATGRYHFQLIDINRMKFLRRPLRPDECMINLRRLSCPAVAFLYILDRYAETRQWDMDDTLLRGTFFRLLFRTPPAVQEAFQGAQTGRDRQKTGLKIWISGIFHYICQRLIHQGDNETLRFCILFLLLFSFIAREEAGWHAINCIKQ